MTPEEVIRREYGTCTNFMTPAPLRYGWAIPDRVAYELSEGEGFSREPIYGVTFVRLNADKSTTRLTDQSKVVWSRKEATALIMAVATTLYREGK